MTKKNIKTINPFDNLGTSEIKSESRKLDLTPQLQSVSNSRATELMRAVGTNEELIELANLALDRAEKSDVFNLINAVFDDATQTMDAEFMTGADEDQLSRLLESRRSDMSKAKTKGPRSSIQVCQTFISSAYAELLVRKILGKPYQAVSNATTLDYDSLAADQDALNKKIRSLQSKQSNLRKTAGFVEADKVALTEVMAEIDRLKSLRINAGNVSASQVIKSVDAELLRAALAKVDANDLDAEQQAKLEELMKKLG